MLSLAKLHFGQQSFFQHPRTLCDAIFTCEVAITMPLLWDFASVTVSLRWYYHTSLTSLLAEIDLLIFTPEMWPLMEEGTISPFTSGISATLPLFPAVPEAGNRHALLPADCGKLAQELGGKERHNVKGRRWAPPFGPALMCTLQTVFCSPFRGEIQHAWPILWLNIPEMLCPALWQPSEKESDGWAKGWNKGQVGWPEKPCWKTAVWHRRRCH